MFVATSRAVYRVIEERSHRVFVFDKDVRRMCVDMEEIGVSEACKCELFTVLTSSRASPQQSASITTSTEQAAVKHKEMSREGQTRRVWP